MTCNCDNDGSNEYIIELGEFGLPGAKGDRGEQGYSPVVSYTTNSDTIQFTLVNENSTLTTPNYYDYLAKKDLSNSPIYTILSDYPTNSQVASTYLKVDGSNANNPITINNLPIQKSGMGAKLGNTNIDRLNLQAKAINLVGVDSNGDQQSVIQMASGGTLYIYAGGSLQFKGSGVRPAYTQNGGTAKSLALYTDLPTKTSQLTNDSGFLIASDITNKMATDGSNATSNIAINGIAFRNQSNFNNIIKAKDGLNLELTNGGSVGDYTKATIYLTTSGNAQISGDNNVSLSAINDIHLNTTNGKVYYGASTDATKEIATLGNINDATITITQGGVTKGTFTLNQSGNATIALDAGGSASTNPIVLKTTDESRSLTLGLNNDTKKAYMTYTISNEGMELPLPIKLIAGKSAPITLTETNEGMTVVGLDYNTNTLGLDTNNKLAVDSDYIEAHKAYLADGDTLTDPQGLQDVKYYNHSSFDLSKFTVVGTPTITDDGIASGFSSSNYLLTSIAETYDITSHTYTFGVKYTYATGGDGVIARFGRFWLVFDNGSSIIRLQGQNADNAPRNFTNATIPTPQDGDEYYIRGSFGDSGNVRSLSVSVNGGTPITGTDTANTPNTSMQASVNIWVGINNSTSPLVAGSVDLKTVWLRTDGFLTFSGNKTGVDTYTIGSDTIIIPYKLSKTGSKIVDSSRRPEVEAVYEDQGYAPYYTLDETNGNFTLPMGEIYGYITRLEGIVKDLQTRLTALESNIDAGGAGVVQQSLLGMSPLSLSRPQLFGMFNPEDEMGTMDIEPIEEDIQEEELEPQETEEETEEGGQDE